MEWFKTWFFKQGRRLFHYLSIFYSDNSKQKKYNIQSNWRLITSNVAKAKINKHASAPGSPPCAVLRERRPFVGQRQVKLRVSWLEPKKPKCQQKCTKPKIPILQVWQNTRSGNSEIHPVWGRETVLLRGTHIEMKNKNDKQFKGYCIL